jgi:SAM-dependent methyltransferase
VIDNILKGYEEAANGDFIERVEGISSAVLLAPVIEYFPQQPSRFLDVGAGTGRDAAWFASLSHTVVAVEPVDALRNAGIAKHKSPNISWVKDTLPQLQHTVALRQTFDVILLCAVWQHLDDDDRQIALSSLRKLTLDGGKIVMSIRHGAGAPTRPVFPAKVLETVKWAEARGLSKVDEVSTQSVQSGNHQVGVTWTWLVLQTHDHGR